ncbi:MAG: polyamine aminopropyltransferase [Deferrisomatales bacterium]
MWCEETFADRVRYGLRASRVVYEGRSAYQTIAIYETLQYGRVLALDGVFQTGERGEHFYHEMIAHPALCAAPSPERVLVIGGGDGGTAREVLRHPEVRSCVLVEIDGLVMEACREHLPLGRAAWRDPRLEVVLGDGVAYVREAPSSSFDVVIVDGSDPVGPSEGLFGEGFYRHCSRVLAGRGVFVTQSESPILDLELFLDIQRRLRAVFPRVTPLVGPAPLYGAEQWSWTLCTHGADPLEFDVSRAARVEPLLRYYHRDLHRASAVLSAELRRLLG